MVVVYLRNGEKAPIPDCNEVRLDDGGSKAGAIMLRCFFGDSEVGVFRWEEVAGYSMDAPLSHQMGSSSRAAYDAWGVQRP